MSERNICWDCRHNQLKLKILVPQNHTIKEYVHKTGDFNTDIVAIVKGKYGQYNVWFRSDGNMRLLSFRMLHVCKLKHEKGENGADCSRYELKQGKNSISNIIYSKTPVPEQQSH